MKPNRFFRLTAVLLALSVSLGAMQAQDLPRFRKLVRQLSSAKYQGRG